MPVAVKTTDNIQQDPDDPEQADDRYPDRILL
jgi:hypothetical protein